MKFLKRLLGKIFGPIWRLIKRIVGAIWRVVRRIIIAIATLLGWLLTLAFCLYAYIGVKGFTYLMTMKYQTVTSPIPLILDISLEGFVGIVLLIVVGYFLSPGWHMTAAVLVFLLCTGVNGFNIWRVITGQLTDLPLLEAMGITAMAFIVGLITCLELGRYKRRKALAAEVLAAGGGATEEPAGG